MKLKELIKLFEDAAPFSLQEDYDNSGIQVGNPEQEVSKGLICLDITEEIMEEALQKGCDLIVSHHPLIFKGIKRITSAHYTERILVKAIKHDVAIVSVHTNLDSIDSGVNRKLAEKLGLKNLRILQPRKGLLKKLVVFVPVSHANAVRNAIFEAGGGKIGEYDCCSFNIEGNGSFRAGESANPFAGAKGQLHFEPEVRIETILPAYLVQAVVGSVMQAHPYEEVAWDLYNLENLFDKTGMGMVGELDSPTDERAFLQMIKHVLGVPVVRHSMFIGKQISRVALCGGSGSFLREAAMASGAEAFVTADVKYHDFFDVQGKLLMADVGHYESEQFTKEILCEIVRKKITNFALLISERSTNPVGYF